jgi:hypothetical protein
VDVARFGNDKSVVTFRRGRAVLAIHEWGKTDTQATAGRVRQLIQAYKETPEQIAVDVIGVGAGVADTLRAWYGDVVEDVNVSLRMGNGQDYNLRAFMWREMKDWLPTASLPNDQDLRADLTSIRYGFKGGELLLESKDDLKKRGVKSPDRGDSLALTFAAPTVKKKQVHIPAGSIVSYGVIDEQMGL